MENNKILELLNYINIFNNNNVLEDQFNEFSKEQDLETINDLLDLCREEASYWEA